MSEASAQLEKSTVNQRQKGAKSRAAIGEGGVLNRQANANPAELQAAFFEVGNRVLWVNPELNLPFNLVEGKQTPLGVFAQSIVKDSSGSLPGEHILEVSPEAGRSALLGRVIFSDKAGNLYRDLDLKGIGFIEYEYLTSFPSYKIDDRPVVHVLPAGEEYDHKNVGGLLNRDEAFKERDFYEKFFRAGIRTIRVASIVDLEELIVDGETITVDIAKDEGIIEHDLLPTIEVRAFGTKARIAEIDLKQWQLLEHTGATFKGKFAKSFLEDAKKLVAQELGRTKALSTSEYLRWFAKTLGENAARMHKNGWIHGNLSSQNITLDCRIVDLATVEKLDSERERDNEQRAAEYVLIKRLSENAVKITAPELDNEQFYEGLKATFETAYDEVFPESERVQYFETVGEYNG